MIKSKPCKLCGSTYHTAAFCSRKPRKPIARTSKKNLQVKRKKKSKSRKQLVSELDSVFSKYIRSKDAIDGISTCVTCGDKKPWKQHQNGHFYSRGRYATRWNEMNCHVQCMRCNVFLRGNYIEYTKFMIDKYGRDAIDELGIKSVSPVKISTPELKELIDYYTLKLKI